MSSYWRTRSQAVTRPSLTCPSSDICSLPPCHSAAPFSFPSLPNVSLPQAAGGKAIRYRVEGAFVLLSDRQRRVGGQEDTGQLGKNSLTWKMSTSPLPPTQFFPIHSRRPKPTATSSMKPPTLSSTDSPGWPITPSASFTCCVCTFPD